MAVVLPQLARAHHPMPTRGLLRHAKGSTSLPVLPGAGDQGLVHEIRHVHRHYHIAVSAPEEESHEVSSPSHLPFGLEPLHEAPEEVESEHSGTPASYVSRLSPKSRLRVPEAEVTFIARENTGQLLLDADVSVDCDSSSSSTAAREESRQRRRPRNRAALQRSQSSAGRELGETIKQWDRYAHQAGASRQVLGRRPLWSHLPSDERNLERRMREIDDEGKWLKQRGEFRRHIKALPDSSDKRKLVGDPRLRNASNDATTSKKAIEKVKQEDIEKSRACSRQIRKAMQDCSKSRQQLKSMQMMLKGVESDEKQRQKAAAAFLMRGEITQEPQDDEASELL